MSFRRFKPSVFLINVGLFIIVGCVFTYELIRALLADRWYMSAVFLGGAMITAGAVLSRRKATYGRKKDASMDTSRGSLSGEKCRIETRHI